MAVFQFNNAIEAANHITAICHYCGGCEMVGVPYMDAVKCVKCDAKYTITAAAYKASWKPVLKMTRDKAIALNNGA